MEKSITYQKRGPLQIAVSNSAQRNVPLSYTDYEFHHLLGHETPGTFTDPSRFATLRTSPQQ